MSRLTRTQRDILSKGRTRGGTPADAWPENDIEVLLHCNLIQHIDLNLTTTPAGRDALDKPVPHSPLYLAHGGEHEHTDYTQLRHRAIDDLEVQQPSRSEIERAREEGAKRRASFARDLEEGRRQQKRRRIERMFREEAA